MKFLAMALALGAGAASPALAEENRTQLVLSLDLLNRQSLETRTRVAGTESRITSTETKSAKPGGLQVSLFTKGWGLLASIAPDSATTGLVGAGYEFIPGQYFGGAYNLSDVEYSDATPSTRSEFYGFLSYNIFPIAEGQKITTLWTIGPTYNQAMQKSADGTQAMMRGQGSQVTLTSRYLHKISDNLHLAPAVKIALLSSRLKAAGLTIKRDITRWELVPIAFQLRI